MSVFALRNYNIVDVVTWIEILDEDHEQRDADDDT